ncbi:hypothetical protein HDE_01645 [Halotydeus destructor]|nr:hypothetical protein HDE_01645 [Halotydeus destructor]
MIRVPKLVFCEPIFTHMLRKSLYFSSQSQYTPADILNSSINGMKMVEYVKIVHDERRITYHHARDSYEAMPFEIERFTKHNMACITLKLKNYGEVKQPNEINVPMNDYMYSIRVNTILSPVSHKGKTFAVPWKIFAHEPEKTCYGNFDPYIHRFVSEPQYLHIGLTFSYKRFQLKEWPHGSECIDYKKDTAYESQAHCFEACYKAKALNKINALPSTLLGNGRDNVAISQPGCREARALDDIREDCRDVCRNPDCILERFVMEQVSAAVYPMKFNKSKTIINLHLPHKPMTSVKEEPKVSVIDFLSFMLGAVGFWFAFSPLVFLTTSKNAEKTFGLVRACMDKYGGRLLKKPINIPEVGDAMKC